MGKKLCKKICPEKNLMGLNFVKKKYREKWPRNSKNAPKSLKIAKKCSKTPKICAICAKKQNMRFMRKNAKICASMQKHAIYSPSPELACHKKSELQSSPKVAGHTTFIKITQECME